MHCRKNEYEYSTFQVELSCREGITYAKVDLIVLPTSLGALWVVDAGICPPRHRVVICIDLRCERPTDKVARVAVPGRGVELEVLAQSAVALINLVCNRVIVSGGT